MNGAKKKKKQVERSHRDWRTWKPILWGVAVSECVCVCTNLIMRAFFFRCLLPYVWTFGIEIVSLERAKFAIVASLSVSLHSLCALTCFRRLQCALSSSLTLASKLMGSVSVSDSGPGSGSGSGLLEMSKLSNTPNAHTKIHTYIYTRYIYI